MNEEVSYNTINPIYTIDELMKALREWRDIPEGGECSNCGGSGVFRYANTATWHHEGLAGQAITWDVCDVCWGSGMRDKPWPSHRDFHRMKHRLEKLEK